MADNVVPADGTGAPADAPALTSEQIQKIISEGITHAFDQRIPGLQSVFDKKVDALNQQVQAIRRSSLTDDEIDEEDDARLKAELAAERSKRAAYELALRNPDVGEDYLRLVTAEKPEDQIEILKAIKKSAGVSTPATDVVPEETDETPPVDMNNPREDRIDGGTVFKNEEQAMSIVEKLWPSRGR